MSYKYYINLKKLNKLNKLKKLKKIVVKKL